MSVNSVTFAARSFRPRQGASDAHIPRGSVRSEQRRRGRKEPPPGGLRRIWPGASLLVGHSPTGGGCSLLAPRPRPNWAQQTSSNLRPGPLSPLPQVGGMAFLNTFRVTRRMVIPGTETTAMPAVSGASRPLLDGPERHGICVFDEDSIAGRDRVGVGLTCRDLVAGELLEFFDARLKDNELRARRQTEQH